MNWVYVLILAAIVTGTVVVVEKYNDAITTSATAKAETSSAKEEVVHLKKQMADLQELIDKADDLSKARVKENVQLEAKVKASDAKLAGLIKNQPETTGKWANGLVDPDARGVRHSLFPDQAGGTGVLHTDQPSARNESASSDGRNQSGVDAGSKPVSAGVGPVQQGQEGRPAPVTTPEQAKNDINYETTLKRLRALRGK